ncbi:hypothetical protein OPV22_017684 [Ensete ventricosum]|uniref:Reverse transcriptase Ty1/copia-type domain-containing protein n=1 Tax=Ensete ventricosum TaxID=4639 RepID=A0AAV8QNV1_ENSVE|nr:hypothetical protein OPV22_017684 [Ensete ventricosum]
MAGCGQPAGVAVARGHTCLQCSTLKGGRVYGVRKGLPPVASPTASRGGDVDRRGGHPLAGWLQLFEKKGRTQRYEISKRLSRITEGTSVENHVLKMIEWIEKLIGLGIVLEDNPCIDLILQSLPDSFSHFIMNFNTSKFEVTLPELLNMLREAESAIKKEKPILYIGKTKNKRKNSKTLKKGKGKERLCKTKVAKKYPGKDKGQCFHYGRDVLARPRRLARGEMDLKMGNGARVAIVAVGERAVFLLKEHILGGNSGSEIELSEVGEPDSSTIPESESVQNLVDAPEGIVLIGCKCIFKNKIGVDGKVETYKARLVAKGYRQRQGVDYNKTFSPVAMLKSIRIILAIAAYYDYEIWQMDVKTTFLNGNLEKEVYMIQSEGFVSK